MGTEIVNLLFLLMNVLVLLSDCFMDDTFSSTGV